MFKHKTLCSNIELKTHFRMSSPRLSSFCQFFIIVFHLFIFYFFIHYHLCLGAFVRAVDENLIKLVNENMHVLELLLLYNF